MRKMGRKVLFRAFGVSQICGFNLGGVGLRFSGLGFIVSGF